MNTFSKLLIIIATAATLGATSSAFALSYQECLPSKRGDNGNTAGPEKESSQNRAGGDSEGKAPLRRLRIVEACVVPRRTPTRDHSRFTAGSSGTR